MFRRASAKIATQDHWLELEDGRIPILLRTNPRARRLIIKVEPAGGRVVVVAPDNRSMSAALKFADGQKQWIKDRLAALPRNIPFVPGAQIPLRGEQCTIDHRPLARRGCWLEPGPDGMRLCVSGGEAHLVRRVSEFLKKEAKADLTQSVERHTRKLGLPMPKISLRDTATRWGSCSSKGVLSFSWRLIIAPPFVLDYVAAHEVAHLKQMNHSKAFWRHVHSLVGDPRPANRWLSTEGSALHRFGKPSSVGG